MVVTDSKIEPLGTAGEVKRIEFIGNKDQLVVKFPRTHGVFEVVFEIDTPE